VAWSYTYLYDGITLIFQAHNFNCFGYLGNHSRPDRWGKYNVTFDQWSTSHYFPQFCSGPCNGINKEETWKIFEAASTTDTKGFKLEDVLFTGIIREKAGIPVPHFQKVFIGTAFYHEKILTIIDNLLTTKLF